MWKGVQEGYYYYYCELVVDFVGGEVMKPSLQASVSLQLSSCRGGVALLLDGKRFLLFVLFVVYLSSLGKPLLHHHLLANF